MTPLPLKPQSPKEIARLVRAITPVSAATLRRVRKAYIGYPDIAVITLCREKSKELATELTSILRTPVSGEQLCNLCIDTERWAERQAWERLMADIAILMALNPEERDKRRNAVLAEAEAFPTKPRVIQDFQDPADLPSDLASEISDDSQAS